MVDVQMPNPNSSLINDQQSISLSIRPKEKKYVRIINMSALATYYLQFGEFASICANRPK